MKGYIYLPDESNWSKEFQQQIRPRAKKIIQPTLFTQTP